MDSISVLSINQFKKYQKVEIVCEYGDKLYICSENYNKIRLNEKNHCICRGHLRRCPYRQGWRLCDELEPECGVPEESCAERCDRGAGCVLQSCRYRLHGQRLASRARCPVGFAEALH